MVLPFGRRKMRLLRAGWARPWPSTADARNTGTLPKAQKATWKSVYG